MKSKTFWSFLFVCILFTGIYWGCTATSSTNGTDEGTSGLLSGGSPCTQDSECNSGLCFGTGSCVEEGCVTQEGVRYCGGGSCTSSLDTCGTNETCVLTSGTCTTCYVAGGDNTTAVANSRCSSNNCNLVDNSNSFGACLEAGQTACDPNLSSFNCTGNGPTPICDSITTLCRACVSDSECITFNTGGTVCSNAGTCIVNTACDSESEEPTCSGSLTCIANVCR